MDKTRRPFTGGELPNRLLQAAPQKRGSTQNVRDDDRCLGKRSAGAETPTEPSNPAQARAHRPRNQRMAFPTVWSSTPKWRPSAATVTPWSRIPAASAAIRWYTGVVGGSRNSTSTGRVAKVRNLCEHVQNAEPAYLQQLTAGT